MDYTSEICRRKSIFPPRKLLYIPEETGLTQKRGEAGGDE
jgi:hypothetical protein